MSRSRFWENQMSGTIGLGPFSRSKGFGTLLGWEPGHWSLDALII